MRFTIDTLSERDIQTISGWRYAAPYDVYSYGRIAFRERDVYRGLFSPDCELLGFLCWAEGARVPIAADINDTHPELLDFGIGMRPDLTGGGAGLFACTYALAWLSETFSPAGFRLAVYEWNRRARKVYARLGFVPVTRRGDFVIMIRDDRPWREASRPLENGMPVYPADPDFDRHLLYRKEDCGWDMSVFSMSAHSGTHIDAPAHIGLPGDTDGISLAWLNGAAQLLHGAPGAISAVRAPRVLIQNGGKGLTLFDAELLLAAGVRMIGIDAMSIGEGDDEKPVHRLLLESGVVILENAALEGFTPGWYEMRCLPLRMPGSDGSPVRLLLREEFMP